MGAQDRSLNFDVETLKLRSGFKDRPAGGPLNMEQARPDEVHEQLDQLDLNS